ncbi:MAG: hypothetical protein M0Z56_00070 [Desulfobacteraceae bacterium]|nr:hypothetical protein [Desulfobacteraceae bacterium]
MNAWIKAILIILILSAAGFYWLTAGLFLNHPAYPVAWWWPKKPILRGNGSRKGKVRWAECTSGPDCDDAGMF